MAGGLQVQVKQSGRVRPARLDNGVLTAIGNEMVKRQLERWSKGINADGNQAKPLGKKYFFVKKAYLRQEHPIRDNRFTGALAANFQLRKAIDGVIRAEPTQRATRAAAAKADQYEQMIGFSGPEINEILKESVGAYGDWVEKAWIPIK
ncbi:MAG TPA: hypothetical protein VGF16_16565 [Bryobacteraceae bacterium]|jgi:hypothetical protein